MSKQKLSRRRFLQASLATGASALGANPAHAGFFSSRSRQTTPALSSLFYYMQVPELFSALPTPPSHSRNLVIGSGFGGSISALRLAQAGEPVTILERGFKWPKSDWRGIFSNDVLPDGRAFWFKNKVKMLTGLNAYMDPFGGVMDATEYDNMTVWRGSCVGGGSVIFTGVMIQPDQTYFDALFQGTVSYAELDNIYYPRVKQMLNLNTMPDDIYQSNPFGHSRVWDKHVRQAGYTSTPIDSIFNWSTVRSELNNRVRKSATIGMSNHGNSNGAKFDLNQNYLSMAEATGKAKVYPGQEVLSIGWDGQRYEVELITRSVTGKQLQHRTITCDRLFMAAGSIGTSELLVKARAQGTLNNLNEHIGEGWGTNGDAIVVRSFSPIAGITQGTPSASRIHDTSHGMPITFENWYAPGVPVDVGIIGSLGMAFDQTNRGQFAWNSRSEKVDLKWAIDGNAEAHSTMETINKNIASASNTVPGAWPFINSVNGMNWTAHPLGGAVLGLATDCYGRVKGHPGLYVMDGAGIPGSTGSVNPALTISALAERNIEQIIKTGS
ncbi:MAG: GMC oxidoreductase [Candidatus Thiodiazotropha sp. 6PLUC2]